MADTGGSPAADPPLEEEKGDIPVPVLQSHDSIDAPPSLSPYFQAMKDYRYSTYALDLTPAAAGIQPEELGTTDTVRMNKEIKNFSKNSPCESAAAIYVAMDAAQTNLMRALISGPEDTPYAHGLYLFNIALRGSYPGTPPIVRILTNGEGKVRFNPNLYSDGYVCLSIINTWEASPEEMWNGETSSLLQVFLSIQSLVMDNEVIQKEPGYEDYSVMDAANAAYTAVVRYNNVKYAMRKLVQSPPAEFQSVIHRHFALKRAEIAATCEKWVSEAESQSDFSSVDYLVLDHNLHTISKFQQKGYANRLRKQVDRLRAVLATLPEVLS